MAALTPADLRVAAFRTLTPQPSLQAALDRMGFLQADPIRAPARAQDLTLLARVPGYRAGELERRYAELDIEEDMIPNYGFVPRAVQALLHPRRLLSQASTKKDRGRSALRCETKTDQPTALSNSNSRLARS